MKKDKCLSIFKRLCWIWDRVVLWLFIPLLIYGGKVISSKDYEVVDFGVGVNLGVPVAIVLAVFLAVALHETSHIAASVACGGKVIYFKRSTFEYIFVDCLGIDDDPIKIVRVWSAGMRANLFLVGCALFALHFDVFNTEMLFRFVAVNLLLCGINCLPSKYADSMKICTALLGIDRKVLDLNNNTIRINEEGINGEAICLLYILLWTVQRLIPYLLFLFFFSRGLEVIFEY